MGNSQRFLLVIGPCSADNEDSVCEYTGRLARVYEKVADKILIIPRVYTNKPRTNGDGYKGLLHQPNPQMQPDMREGVAAIRRMHLRILEECGFFSADEMLYPENHYYLDDMLSYVAVGARSVENQEHRLTASGCDMPVGMKNPTGGDLSVMLNAIYAARQSHKFIYRGWEVETSGNPLSHAILRGFINKRGQHQPNYHFEDLRLLHELYKKRGLDHPAALIDTNHSNSNKSYAEQPRILKEVLYSRRHSPDITALVKGAMVESYLEPGSAPIGSQLYGQSITDPCLGWDETERLIYDIADIL